MFGGILESLDPSFEDLLGPYGVEHHAEPSGFC